MNYVKVLENQIVELEKIQEELIKKVASRKENVTYTERALNVIANTSSKIQSIVNTLIEIEEKETALEGQVQEQQKPTIINIPIPNAESAKEILAEIKKNLYQLGYKL